MMQLGGQCQSDGLVKKGLENRPRTAEIKILVERAAMGVRHFLFHTRIVQVPALDLARFRQSANRVALSFSPNMAGKFDRVEQVLRVAFAFRDCGDLAGFRKFFAFWIVEGKLDLEEQRKVKSRLKEVDMPEIMEWFREEGIALWKAEGIAEGIAEGKAVGKAEGKAEGLREKALEDARRMREHGIEWRIVTDVTGIKPEELGQA